MANQTTIGTFPNPFNLQSVDGQTGFKIPGLNAGDYFGQKISGMGDFNGDGIDDCIMCAFHANNYVGQCYLIFGKAGEGFPQTFNLANIDSTNGIIFNGINQGDYAGYSVNFLGDINKDGIADLGISAYLANNRAGQVYIIYGSRTGLATIYNLAMSDVVISGTSTTQPLGYLNGVGDVNGDGVDDLVVGNLVANKFYLIYGKPGGLSTTINLASLGNNGVTFSLTGSASSVASTVVGVNDVTGDGRNDFLIAIPALGTVFLICGSPNFPSNNNLNNLNGTTGTRFIGSATYSTGFSVSGAGDIYGNGTTAFLIGEPGTTVDTYSGVVYLINGQVGGYPAIVNLASPSNATVTGFNGANSQDHVGTSVKGVGDFNSDGLNDWVTCTANSNNLLAGKCHLVFGSPNGYANQDNFGSLSSSIKGITFVGISLNPVAGVSIGSGFDLNGDGVKDLAFGDMTALPDQTGTYQGQGYVVFGRNNLFPSPSPSPTPSVTKTPTNTATSSTTSSPSITATYTQTSSITATYTQTSSITPSITATSTQTPSITPSLSVTASVTSSHQVLTIQAPPEDPSLQTGKWVGTAFGILSGLAGVVMAVYKGYKKYGRWQAQRKALTHTNPGDGGHPEDALEAGAVAVTAGVVGAVVAMHKNPLNSLHKASTAAARDLFGAGAAAAAQSLARHDIATEVVAVAAGVAGAARSVVVRTDAQEDAATAPSLRTAAAVGGVGGEEEGKAHAPAAIRKPGGGGGSGGGGAGVGNFKKLVTKAKEDSDAVKAARFKAAIDSAELNLAMAEAAEEEEAEHGAVTTVAKARVGVAKAELDLAKAEATGTTGLRLVVIQKKLEIAKSALELAMVEAAEEGSETGASETGANAAEGDHHAPLMGDGVSADDPSI